MTKKEDALLFEDTKVIYLPLYASHVQLKSVCFSMKLFHKYFRFSIEFFPIDDLLYR